MRFSNDLSPGWEIAVLVPMDRSTVLIHPYITKPTQWEDSRKVRLGTGLKSCFIFCKEYKVLYCAGIVEQSMGAKNRVGIGLSYRPARLHRLAEFIRFQGPIHV